jgi:hypothetical protein
MSIDFITGRARIWFNVCRAHRLRRPELSYTSTEGPVGNFGQKRNTAPEAQG